MMKLKFVMSLGYVCQKRDSKRVSAGRCSSLRQAIKGVSRAAPILKRLSDESRESCHFAVRAGDAVVFITRTSGSGAFHLTNRMAYCVQPIVRH
jgi:IclR family transcriptional regulator, KDG regulon repressor